VLSDHERKTLREVERQFLAEDPEFTRSFDTSAQHLRREYRDGESVKIAIFAAALLCGLMLVAGSPGGALAFAAVTGLIWLGWRHSNNPSRRST
jgi:Protein of unknown function (DUF3040)